MRDRVTLSPLSILSSARPFVFWVCVDGLRLSRENGPVGFFSRTRPLVSSASIDSHFTAARNGYLAIKANVISRVVIFIF